MNNAILVTDRMIVSVPSPGDAGSFIRIWEDPDIMVNVGFPNGIPGLQESRIAEIITSCNRKNTVFDRFLKVNLRVSGDFMGECKLGSPDVDRVSETDIKLLRRFQGAGYGSELKAALVRYLFAHTKALGVKATPNVNNAASVRMQEKCGGKRICESVFSASEHGSVDVRYYLYMIYKRAPGAAEGEARGHIIFDLDGTLLDTIDDIGEAVNHALAESGFMTHDISEYKKMVGDGMRLTVKRALPPGTDENTVGEILARVNHEYAAGWNIRTKIYPGVMEMLKKLKGMGYALSLLTNKPHAIAANCAEYFFGPDMFELVRGVKDDKLTKPSTALTLMVMGLLGARPEETAFVGDSITDMDTAAAAGIRPLLLEWGYGSGNRLHEFQAARADSPEKLLEYFTR